MPIRARSWHALLASLDPPKRAALRARIVAEPRAFNAFPVTANQQQIWWELRRSGDVPDNNFGFCLELTGHVDVPALEAAFRALVFNHEVLRSSLHLLGGKLWQLVEPVAQEEQVLEVVAPSDAALGRASETAIRHAWEDFRYRPFRVDSSRWVRARLLRIAEDRNVLMVAVHRIAFDDWSAGILVHDLSAAYRAALGNGTPPAPPPVQVGDFALWQHDVVTEDYVAKAANYWAGLLSDVRCHPIPATGEVEHTDQCANRRVDVPGEVTRRIDELTRDAGLTLFNWYSAIWLVLLGSVVGAKVATATYIAANREVAGASACIGDFGNMTFLVHPATGNETPFIDLVRRVQHQLDESRSHARAPIGSVLWRIAQRDGGQGGLPVRTALNFMRLGDADRRFEMPGVEAVPRWFPSRDIRSPFELEWRIIGGTLGTQLVYRCGKFTDDDVRGWERALRFVLAETVRDEFCPLGYLVSSVRDRMAHAHNGATDNRLRGMKHEPIAQSTSDRPGHGHSRRGSGTDTAR